MAATSAPPFLPIRTGHHPTPTRATEIGPNEAIVVQQLHYWLRASGHEKSGDGRRWVHNTYTQWQSDNFPFWSVRTIQSTFLKLEEAGLIESTDRFNADVRDRTKWYTVNYEHPILSDHDANPASPKSAQGLRGQDADPAPSSIQQRLHTEITREMWGEMFDEFWTTYPKKMDKGHARKTERQRTPHHEQPSAPLGTVLPRLRKDTDTNANNQELPSAYHQAWCTIRYSCPIMAYNGLTKHESPDTINQDPLETQFYPGDA